MSKCKFIRKNGQQWTVNFGNDYAGYFIKHCTYKDACGVEYWVTKVRRRHLGWKFLEWLGVEYHDYVLREI